jgi:cation/acetate symporter
MLSGIGFTASYIIYFKWIAASSGPEQWLFGISPEGIGTIGMLLNFTVTLLVSRFTPAPPREVQEMIEEMRLPRRAPLPPTTPG